jgi:hypothetical protein
VEGTSFASNLGPVLHLAVWGHYVAWAQALGRARVPTQAVVWDRESGQAKSVADDPTGEIDPVVGGGAAGTTVIYTELEHPIGDQHPNSAWRVVAVDINSGKERVLARSAGESAGLAAPIPRSIETG